MSSLLCDSMKLIVALIGLLGVSEYSGMIGCSAGLTSFEDLGAGARVGAGAESERGGCSGGR